MNAIVSAVTVLGCVSAVCALLLIIASKYMAVPVDENFPKIRACLPGANCGACGYAGCDGYATALASGEETKTNKCIPGADAAAAAIAAVLGVEAEDVIEQVAVVHCLGTCEVTKNKADYEGIQSCAAAKLAFGGPGSCVYGCFGLGDCLNVCPNGAVSIRDGVSHIDVRKCVGCGMCVKTCPQGIITLMADVERVVVTCSNKEKGAQTRKECTHGCIGCRKCERVCSSGAIKVVDNLAVIDYDKCPECEDFGICARECTTGCIVLGDYTGATKVSA